MVTSTRAVADKVYARYFPGDRPPARAGLPKGVRVEIDCIAVVVR